MPHELIHTSAVRGLALGTDGYCVVAETPGLPKALRAQLERLSGYRHRVPGRRPDPTANPVAVSHQIVSAGGERYHVLSRIADAGFDHTDRTNYIAHHLAFTADELPAGGPAWLAQQPRVFQTDWPPTRPPETLPAGRRLPAGSAPARRCDLWNDLTGDGGWAGVLAAARDPVAVLYTPGQPVLDLIAEALALLPDDRRWRVPFTTYFTGGADFLWRFMPADSREAKAALDGKGTVLRVDRPTAGSPGGPLVAAARTGVVIDTEAPARRSTSEPLPFADDDTPSHRRRRRPAEVGDEPEVEPTRPPRKKKDADEPRRPADPPARGGSPVLPTVIGLVFGLALAALLGTVVELAGGKSLLHMIGQGPEKELEAEKEKWKKEHGEATAERDRATAEQKFQTDEARKARTDRDAVRGELTELKKEYGQLEGKYNLSRLQVKSLWEKLDEKSKAGDGWAAEKAALEGSHKTALDAANAQVKQAQADADAGAKALPLPPGRPLPVLPPNTKATVELVVPPAGLKATAAAEAVSLTDAGNAVVGTLTYTAASGRVELKTLDRAALPTLTGGVAKVKPEQGPAVYLQLGPPPVYPDGGMRSDGKGFVLDLTAAFNKRTDLGFAGPVLVRVGKDKFVPLTPTPDKPTEATGKDGETAFTAALEGGKLTLTGVADAKAAVAVVWAELRPPAGPVLVRITDTK